VFEAEPEEPGIMRRPPRASSEPLFGGRTLAISILQGLSVLAVALALFGFALHQARPEVEARALSFTTLVLGNLGLILANRSWSRTIFAMLAVPNAALWWVLGGALAFLGLVLYLPGLRELFHFAPLHADDLLLCLGAAVASVAWFEIFKLFRNEKLY
jgi:Ca2+-transporting ATPase